MCYENVGLWGIAEKDVPFHVMPLLSLSIDVDGYGSTLNPIVPLAPLSVGA